MYQITRLKSGLYYCEGSLQDGTERWSKKTLNAAIKSMISFAKNMNNSKIKEGDIEFYFEEYVTKLKRFKIQTMDQMK